MRQIRLNSKTGSARGYFSIDAANAEPTPNYSVAPAHQVLVISSIDSTNELFAYRWGLIPFWAKDINIGYKMIKAPYETLASKPAFREEE